MDEYPDIYRNYARVSERIGEAALAAGRNPEEVKLVVVTKGQPAGRIQAVLAAGAERLGENYVEEAAEKMQQLGSLVRVEWRMIGHLQSNKARQAVQNFQALDSLDSLKLANRLERFCADLGRLLPVLLEFNLSGESSKTGWPAWEESSWPALSQQIRLLLELKHLSVQGLMTMPPFFDDPELAVPYFRKLRRLQDFLRGRIPELDWNELSMGMSGDYQVAIREGATMVRIGTAIMGLRQNVVA